MDRELGRVKRQELRHDPIPMVLDRLFSRQVAEFMALDLLHRNLDDQSTLIDFYKTTGLFLDSYRTSKNFLAHCRTEAQMEIANSQLAGKFFEDLSFLFLAWEELKKGRIVLSPEKVKDFWARLYPNAELVEYTNGTTFQRYNIPDGLIIEAAQDKKRIVYACEYTASNEVTRGYIGKSRRLDDDKDNFPSILGSAEKLIVLGKDRIFPAVNGFGKVAVRNMPLDLKYFGKFVHRVIDEYRDGGRSLTISELRNSVLTRIRNEDSQKEGTMASQLRQLLGNDLAARK